MKASVHLPDMTLISTCISGELSCVSPNYSEVLNNYVSCNDEENDERKVLAHPFGMAVTSPSELGILSCAS